jgi:hypothetical protein
MSDLQARLDRALKAGGPATRDPMFRIEVLLRRERQAFRRRLIASAGAALVAAIIAALGVAVLGDTVAPGPARLALLAAAGVVLTAVLTAPHLGTLPALRRLAGRWWTRS